jgi:hypothetical protein
MTGKGLPNIQDTGKFSNQSPKLKQRAESKLNRYPYDINMGTD